MQVGVGACREVAGGVQAGTGGRGAGSVRVTEQLVRLLGLWLALAEAAAERG